MTSPQDPSSVATAIRALATLERLDLNPRLPKSEAVEWSASAILAAAGPVALDEIEAAIPTATGTGRVALALAVRSIDPERGAQLAARLADDPHRGVGRHLPGRLPQRGPVGPHAGPAAPNLRCSG